MKKKTDTPLVTKTALAAILQISTQNIDSWKIRKDFGKCYDGTLIDLSKAIKFVYDWKNEEAEESKSTANEEKKYWDAKNSELKYKTATEELIPKSNFLQTERERLEILKSDIMSIPDKLAITLDLSPDQKKLVENVCKSCLINTKTTFLKREKDWIDFCNKPLEVISEVPQTEENDKQQ